MDNKNEKSLFISYCWGDGTPYADDLENQLSDYFNVIRDKSLLEANDDIYDFMGKVASCDFVVIVLTDGYVRSQNCMFEMTTLAEEPDWKERAFVLVIDETIYKVDRKLEIINYWMMQKKYMTGKKIAFEEGKDILDNELEVINKICEELESILSEISRIKNPSPIAIVNEVVRRYKKGIVVPEEITVRQQRMIEYLKKNPHATMKQIGENMGISLVAVNRTIRELMNKNIIEREGTGKQWFYVIR